MKMACIFAACLFSLPAMALSVFIDNGETQKSKMEVAEGSRINSVLENAGVNEEAFFIGASWQRQSEKKHQLRLKDGILFDLQILQQQAHLDNKPLLADAALNLEQQIRAMTVTGRLLHIMDPAALLGTRIDHLLEEGDRLVFPVRPTGILVLGATVHGCTVPFAALHNVNYYLEKCPHSEQADNNYIIVVQPDGAIFREGIALWNKRSFTFIAPGAIIFLPFSEAIYSEITKELNLEIAEFLATQTPVMVKTP